MTLRRQVPPPPPPPEGVDPHLQQWTLDLEQWVRIKVRVRVRQAVLRYVLPGLLISGLGVVAALALVYRDSQGDRERACQAAIDARINFRTFAFGQHDQWDDVVSLFPTDDLTVQQVQQITDDNRADTERNYPAPTKENMLACGGTPTGSTVTTVGG